MTRRIPSAAVGPGVAPHCPECNAKALRATSRFCDLCGAALVSDGEPRSSHYARAIATSDDLGVAPTEAGIGAEEGHYDVQMLRVSFDVQQLPDLARLPFEAYHGQSRLHASHSLPRCLTGISSVMCHHALRTTRTTPGSCMPFDRNPNAPTRMTAPHRATRTQRRTARHQR